MFNLRNRYYLLLIFSTTAILTATISPFNFILPQNLSWQEIIKEFHLFTNIKDYVRNIILFVPLGITWGGIIASKKYSFWQIILFAWLFGVVLSSNIEVIQILLPSRTSSISDIICNSLGSLIGSALYCSRANFGRLFYSVFHRQYQQIDLRFLGLVIFTYATTVFCTFSLFYNSINFNNWNKQADLSLASEITGQIFWRGYINSLHICDRALVKGEIERAFQDTHSFFSGLSNLVTSFVFLDYRPYYSDFTRNLADLHWHQDLSRKKINYSANSLPSNSTIDNLIHQQKNVLFNKQNSLISSLPATTLTQKIQKSQEFSLSVILATDKLNQVGPSRIISLGENIYSRNLILGQEGSKLIIRLRTPTTGANATQPGFFIPDFFQDTKLHQILITFANNNLTVYLDRPETKYNFSFQPATHLKLFAPWIFKYWSVDLTTYNLLQAQVIFYGLILAPLVILSIIFLLVFILTSYNKLLPNIRGKEEK